MMQVEFPMMAPTNVEVVQRVVVILDIVLLVPLVSIVVKC